MTREQAKAEAHKRWGKRGYAYFAPALSQTCCFRVGLILDPLAIYRSSPVIAPFEVIGWGGSWEQAFADADRELRDREHD